MSKANRPFTLIFAPILLILQLFNNSSGQDLEVRIKVDASRPNEAVVDGVFREGRRANTRSLSFALERAGVRELGKRVGSMKLAERGGSPVGHRELAPGEYVADADFGRWSYVVNLEPPGQTGAAHASWIDGERGVFMLGDLLPIAGAGAVSGRINFDLPAGWQALSTTGAGNNLHDVKELESAVFAVGKGWRRIPVHTGSPPVAIAVHGDWLFTDEEASAMAAEVYAEYRRVFGAEPAGPKLIVLSKFPKQGRVGAWQAETRGSTILIVSGDMPHRNQSLQRLHEQLRHELFHLWVPNGVNLAGSYDWFYEGFALYLSLKSAVKVNRIRFEDFMDTLSRAYAIDKRLSPRVPLISASQNRWGGADTQVYARGMLVAFVCDIVMLNGSRGKRSIEDLLKEIYQKHRFPAERADGNGAVLGVMRRHAELGAVAEKYTNGAETFAAADFAPAGIELAEGSGRTGLRLMEKRSSRQKGVLDELGYNSWRKLVGK